MPAQPIWDRDRLTDPHHQQDKARRVMAMFDAIAPTYERVNSVLSLRRDAAWRRRLVELAGVQPGDVLLDLACGTGDVARSFARATPRPRRIVGADFAHGMLQLAEARPIARDGRNPATNDRNAHLWLRADAMMLPLADASVDIVTCAFGLRNLQQPAAGIREMVRVLRPGGRCLILEFGLPRSTILRSAYLGYFRHVLPRVANAISRDRTGAYSYLPQSVMTFLSEQQVAGMLAQAGLPDSHVEPQTFGIAYIARGRKA